MTFFFLIRRFLLFWLVLWEIRSSLLWTLDLWSCCPPWSRFCSGVVVSGSEQTVWFRGTFFWVSSSRRRTEPEWRLTLNPVLKHLSSWSFHPLIMILPPPELRCTTLMVFRWWKSGSWCSDDSGPGGGSGGASLKTIEVNLQRERRPYSFCVCCSSFLQNFSCSSRVGTGMNPSDPLWKTRMEGGDEQQPESGRTPQTKPLLTHESRRAFSTSALPAAAPPRPHGSAGSAREIAIILPRRTPQRRHGRACGCSWSSQEICSESQTDSACRPVYTERSDCCWAKRWLTERRGTIGGAGTRRDFWGLSVVHLNPRFRGNEALMIIQSSYNWN